MNKKAVIGIGVAAVAAVVIGAVWFTQGARLKAVASVAKSATMNAEQVTAKTEENAQIEQEIREQYQIPDLALSDEMQAAIADGSMSLEEVAQSLLTSANAQASLTEEPSPAPEAPSDSGQTDAEAPPPSDSGQTAPKAPPPSDSGQTDAEAPPPSDSGWTEPEAPPPSDSGWTEPEAPPPSDVGQTEPEAPPPSDVGQTEPEAPPPSDAGQTEPPQASEAETPSDSGQTEAPQKTEAEKAEEEKNDRVQNLITQLYVLRSSFTARLDAVIDECIQEFLKLDPSQQTRTAKIRIVYSRMSDLEKMEAECDAQVEEIAAELDEIDPALGAKARQQYKNEKELKKASLISQYGG